MVHPQALLVFFFLSQTSAHFLLNYPPTIGKSNDRFDDDLENTAPCGSFTPDFSTDNVTDFGVGGNAIALTSIHPEATWLFRATLDQTASGNWTTLLPAIKQTGLGAYCEPDVTVPASWAGSKGIIGIVQDAPDGILYQVLRPQINSNVANLFKCAAVNFVAGTITAPSSCTNVTGLSATDTTDTALSSLAPSATSSGSPTSSIAISTTISSTTATTKASAAMTLSPFDGSGSFVWVGMIAFAGLGAFLL
ncbi:Uncharacterized protein D0Z07_4917 [Hyphodiscus hymeniophilus]|uniref:Copper acquisition factor BIM1-like domain-containing protein n=1 Tax=Hyphodiscus hymeniophilus TaxID=353542 RepID=A0A9P6VIQ6_9HELO|nr:Uncharacterized protein D0Z07_4917 [Hyphodiscus hymeniophilus]